MLPEFGRRHVMGSVVYTAKFQVVDLKQRINSMYESRQLWIYEAKVYEECPLSLSGCNRADTCIFKEAENELELILEHDFFFFFLAVALQ